MRVVVTVFLTITAHIVCSGAAQDTCPLDGSAGSGGGFFHARSSLILSQDVMNSCNALPLLFEPDHSWTSLTECRSEVMGGLYEKYGVSDESIRLIDTEIRTKACAKRVYRNKIQLEPNSGTHYFDLGTVLLESGDEGEAIKAFDSAISLNETLSLHAISMKGLSYGRLRNWEAVLNTTVEYMDLVDVNDKKFRADEFEIGRTRILMGYALVQMKRINEAVRAFLPLATANYGDAHPRLVAYASYNMATIHMRYKQYDDAVRMFRKAIHASRGALASASYCFHVLDLLYVGHLPNYPEEELSVEKEKTFMARVPPMLFPYVRKYPQGHHRACRNYAASSMIKAYNVFEDTARINQTDFRALMVKHSHDMSMAERRTVEADAFIMALSNQRVYLIHDPEMEPFYAPDTFRWHDEMVDSRFRNNCSRSHVFHVVIPEACDQVWTREDNVRNARIRLGWLKAVGKKAFGFDRLAQNATYVDMAGLERSDGVEVVLKRNKWTNIVVLKGNGKEALFGELRDADSKLHLKRGSPFHPDVWIDPSHQKPCVGHTIKRPNLSVRYAMSKVLLGAHGLQMAHERNDPLKIVGVRIEAGESWPHRSTGVIYHLDQVFNCAKRAAAAIERRFSNAAIYFVVSTDSKYAHEEAFKVFGNRMLFTDVPDVQAGRDDPALVQAARVGEIVDFELLSRADALVSTGGDFIRTAEELGFMKPTQHWPLPCAGEMSDVYAAEAYVERQFGKIWRWQPQLARDMYQNYLSSLS